MARSVEDVVLLDAIVTGGSSAAVYAYGTSLKGVRIGFAPRQHLDLVDVEVERAFRMSLEKLREAGAELVEIDLGADFNALAYQANWPIFFHETMPHVDKYLKSIEAPATFQQIYEGLGANVDFFWSDAVVPGSPNFVAEAEYLQSLNVHRPAIQLRYAEAFRVNRIDALLFPTTPLVAPTIGTAGEVTIAGQVVPALNIAKNVFASSCAGLPGISLPMGLSSEGLPMGLEIDGQPGEDLKILNIAAQISAILGPIAAPRMT